MSIVSLGIDELSVIVQVSDARSKGRLAQTCGAFCDLVRDETHGADLEHLKRRPNQSQLCESFYLTPNEAKRLHYTEKHVFGFCYHNIEHLFDLHQVMDDLVDLVGGWPGVADRLQRRATKIAKRLALEKRRAYAVATRKASINTWLADEMPFGDSIANFEDWRSSCTSFVETTGTSTSSELDDYVVRNQIKTTASFEDAKACIFRLTKRAQLAKSRRKAIDESLKERGIERGVGAIPCWTLQRLVRNSWKFHQFQDDAVSTAKLLIPQIRYEMRLVAEREAKAEWVAKRYTEVDERRASKRARNGSLIASHAVT